MFNKTVVRNSTNIDNRKTEEELKLIERDILSKEEFNSAYTDRTSVQKIIAGFTEYDILCKYLPLIKGIGLKDGEKISLENSKVLSHNGVLSISSKEETFTINLSELKRIFFKYSYSNEAIRIQEMYAITETKNPTYEISYLGSSHDNIIDISKYTSSINFKELGQRYLISNTGDVFDSRDVRICMYINISYILQKGEANGFNIPIIIVSKTKNTFKNITMEKEDLREWRKTIETAYEYDYDTKDIQLKIGEEKYHIMQLKEGMCMIWLSGKVVLDLFTEHGLEEIIYSDKED